MDTSTEQLIKGCQKGKRESQNAFCHHYGGLMKGICVRYTSNHQEAEDLLQETLLKALDHIHKFDFKGSFEGWLRKLTLRQAINHWHRQGAKNRDQHHLEDLAETTEAISLSAEALSNLSVEELQGHIQALPERYRMVFNLYAIEGYSHQEIAELLGITVSTSKSQLVRARQSLQASIQQTQKYYCYAR